MAMPRSVSIIFSKGLKCVVLIDLTCRISALDSRYPGPKIYCPSVIVGMWESCKLGGLGCPGFAVCYQRSKGAGVLSRRKRGYGGAYRDLQN